MRHSGDAKRQEHKLYAVLNVAEEDLRQANFFAAHLLKKGWHYEPWERRWTVYMQQAAFTTAFATAYSRPFTKSRGWPKFPERLLRKFSPEQRDLHERVLTLRNMVYAHSDVGGRSITLNSEGDPTIIEVLPPMRFAREELMALQTMISAMQESISARKHDLIPSVGNESNAF